MKRLSLILLAIPFLGALWLALMVEHVRHINDLCEEYSLRMDVEYVKELVAELPLVSVGYKEGKVVEGIVMEPKIVLKSLLSTNKLSCEIGLGKKQTVSSFTVESFDFMNIYEIGL